MKSKPIAVSLSILAACAFGAFQSMAADNQGSVADKDAKFIKKTADAGMAEVKLAELGTQKAERADVKEFAKMMVDDHTKSNTELATLAKSKGVETSQMISEKGADKFKDLENEKGGAFDKAFLDQMEKEHKNMIDDFEDAQKDVKDGELKAWIDKTLPTLRAHLDHVKKLKGNQ
jgi:putative membrane protein